MNINITVTVGETEIAVVEDLKIKEMSVDVPDAYTATALDLRESIHNMIAMAVSEYAAEQTREKINAVKEGE